MAISKRFKEKLSYFIINPFVLATPFLALAFILLSGNFKKYDAEFVRKKRVDKENSIVFFKDLNHDGNDDEISFFNNNEGAAARKITLFEKGIFGQFNMKGGFNPAARLFLVDNYFG